MLASHFYLWCVHNLCDICCPIIEGVLNSPVECVHYRFHPSLWVLKLPDLTKEFIRTSVLSSCFLYLLSPPHCLSSGTNIARELVTHFWKAFQHSPLYILFPNYSSSFVNHFYGIKSSTSPYYLQNTLDFIMYNSISPLVSSTASIITFPLQVLVYVNTFMFSFNAAQKLDFWN